MGDNSTRITHEDPKSTMGINISTTQTSLPSPSANHPNTSAHNTNDRNQLPIVLLSNIQSFGKTDKTDKTAELELVLKLNKIQIGIFTETWLDETTCQHLDMDNYVMFHSTRKKHYEHLVVLYLCDG